MISIGAPQTELIQCSLNPIIKVLDINNTKYVRIELNIKVKILFIKLNTVVKILQDQILETLFNQPNFEVILKLLVSFININLMSSGNFSKCFFQRIYWHRLKKGCVMLLRYISFQTCLGRMVISRLVSERSLNQVLSN